MASKNEGGLLKGFQDEPYKNIVGAVALSTLACFLSVSVPVIGFLCFVFLPLPITFYRVKLGRKTGAVAALSALVFTAIFIGSLTADIFFLLGMMLLGFSMGEFIEKDLPIEKTIGYACALVVLSGTFLLILYGNTSNLGVMGVVSDYIGKNLKLSIALYKKMGMAEDNLRMLSESADKIRYVLVRIIPSLLTAGLLCAAWLNLLLARFILRPKNMLNPALFALNRWEAPDFLVWGVIGTVVMILMPVGLFQFVGLNGFIVLMTIYFFQGIAIISFYLAKKKIPMALRFLCYSFIAIQQILVFVVIGLGFFDVWLKFRRPVTKNNNG
jgi:uncharacterized protein YybS (DUF2232 family)